MSLYVVSAERHSIAIMNKPMWPMRHHIMKASLSLLSFPVWSGRFGKARNERCLMHQGGKKKQKNTPWSLAQLVIRKSSLPHFRWLFFFGSLVHLLLSGICKRRFVRTSTRICCASEAAQPLSHTHTPSRSSLLMRWLQQVKTKRTGHRRTSIYLYNYATQKWRKQKTRENTARSGQGERESGERKKRIGCLHISSEKESVSYVNQW